MIHFSYNFYYASIICIQIPNDESLSLGGSYCEYLCVPLKVCKQITSKMWTCTLDNRITLFQAKAVAGRRNICWPDIFYTFKRRRNPITNWDVNSLIKLSNKYTFKNRTPLQITHFHCRPIDKKRKH